MHSILLYITSIDYHLLFSNFRPHMRRYSSTNLIMIFSNVLVVFVILTWETITNISLPIIPVSVYSLVIVLHKRVINAYILQVMSMWHDMLSLMSQPFLMLLNLFFIVTQILILILQTNLLHNMSIIFLLYLSYQYF